MSAQPTKQKTNDELQARLRDALKGVRQSTGTTEQQITESLEVLRDVLVDIQDFGDLRNRAPAPHEPRFPIDDEQLQPPLRRALGDFCQAYGGDPRNWEFHLKGIAAVIAKSCYSSGDCAGGTSRSGGGTAKAVLQPVDTPTASTHTRKPQP